MTITTLSKKKQQVEGSDENHKLMEEFSSLLNPEKIDLGLFKHKFLKFVI